MAVANKSKAESDGAVAANRNEDFIQLLESSSSEDEQEEGEEEEEEDTSDKEQLASVTGKKRKSPEADSSEIEIGDDDNDNGGNDNDGWDRGEAAGSRRKNKLYTTCYNGEPIPPWLKGAGRLGRGERPLISDIFNEEVARFVEYISPTPEERQMREWVIERLQRVLNNMRMAGVEAKAMCFGSFSTDLYLPTSDIDMTVMLFEHGTKRVSHNYQTKEAVRRFLYTLAKALKNAGFCTRCEVIAKARVPIIKTHESITGIAVDISINADSGLGSANVQKSFSNHVYPYSLRAIVLVIKQFLSQRSMNEVYTGGMGSYAITLLVVSFLQMHPRIKSGGLDIAKNLGVLLIEFFELYGKRFNYDQVCISVRENGRYFDKRAKGMMNHSQPYLLAVEDPCDVANDVTKGTYGINRIKQTFSGAYDLINNAIFAYHQTMKFGEPINDTLKAIAGGNNNSRSSAKRAKGKSGKAEKPRGSSAFNDDPWAPVSILSSIVSINKSVTDERAKLVDTFHRGRMQSVLGVDYQPQLTRLLPQSTANPPGSNSLTSGTPAPAMSNKRLEDLTFDFTRPASADLSNNNAVFISDDEDDYGYSDASI
ncbi:hypothetical protein GGI12_003516 [Dipsacomyces acuminosporus]|nr:hypothetical protein GGI12_003516 [Dipsacomyces acuminosporus]